MGLMIFLTWGTVMFGTQFYPRIALGFGTDDPKACIIAEFGQNEM